MKFRPLFLWAGVSPISKKIKNAVMVAINRMRNFMLAAFSAAVGFVDQGLRKRPIQALAWSNISTVQRSSQTFASDLGRNDEGGTIGSGQILVGLNVTRKSLIFGIKYDLALGAISDIGQMAHAG